MSDKARLEVVKSRKPERQNGVPIPGSDESVTYEGAQRKLSVVETCNGGPGTTTALRVEVVTHEAVVTAGRPNYRISVDIPLDEALVGILATALDRAEETASQHESVAEFQREFFEREAVEDKRRELFEADATDILLYVDHIPVGATELTAFREFYPGPMLLFRSEEDTFRQFRANYAEKAGISPTRDANDHSDIMQDFCGPDDLPTERVPETDKKVPTPRSLLKDGDGED